MGMPIIKASDTTRSQAIIDIFESIALQQVSLAHILNAEGEKIQKILNSPSISSTDILEVNDSVTQMINNITSLEHLLQSKAELFMQLTDEPIDTTRFLILENLVKQIQNQANIISLQVSEIANQINVIENEIHQNTVNISLLQTEVVQYGKSITNMNEQITKLLILTNDLSNKYDVIDESLSILNTSVTSMEVEINTIDHSIAILNNSFNTFENEIDTLNQSIVTLNNSVTSIGTDINQNTTVIEALKVNQSNMNTAIVNLNTQVSQLQKIPQPQIPVFKSSMFSSNFTTNYTYIVESTITSFSGYFTFLPQLYNPSYDIPITIQDKTGVTKPLLYRGIQVKTNTFWSGPVLIYITANSYSIV